MNSLIYNPSVKVVEQWRDIYLNFDEIQEFQVLIDRIYMYLEIIETQKQKKIKNQASILDFKVIVSKDIAKSLQQSKNYRFLTQSQIKEAQQKLKQVEKMKLKFEEQFSSVLKSRKFVIPDGMTRAEYHQMLKLKYLDPSKYRAVAYSKLDFGKLIEIFENHLSYLQRIIIQNYTRYFFEDDALIEKFVAWKEKSLRSKIERFKHLVDSIIKTQKKNTVQQLKEQSQRDIKTIFQNLYIQSDYLAKLVHTNKIVFQKFEEDHENSFEYLKQIRIEHKKIIQRVQIVVQKLKQQVREVYISFFKVKKAGLKDRNRLEKNICNQVAVNADQFQQTSNSDAFINGVFFSILLFCLIGILVFRGMTLSTLEQSSSYLTEFKIWRGASYLIFMNWVLGIVLYLFDYFKINYRLVLLQADTFVPKPQAFLKTAVTLSAIYLILFLVYLFKAVGYIQGNDLLHHLGYFMWLINLIFLLNPLKIMNYEGRRYFIELFAKVLVSIFRRMNLNIFLVAMIIGSFIQPFTDLAFTACSLVYHQQRDCLQETRVATFVFTLVFLTIRFGHSIRSHIQLNSNKLTRPLIGLIAVVFSFNNVLSSFLYNTYLTDGLLAYWIISAILATFAGLNADIRADFGLISFDEEDCLLRKYKRFPRLTYFILVIIDFFLNIGWVFSVSNNLSFADSINPIYFLMVLSYIELSRKGMWIFFRVEDDHSANVGTLTALLSDQPIYVSLRERHNIIEKKNAQNVDSSNVIIDNKEENQNNSAQTQKNKETTLQQLQQQIKRKKEYLKQVKAFKEELSEYLTLIHQRYTGLQWQEQYL